jgi:deoxyribonuclease-4
MLSKNQSCHKDTKISYMDWNIGSHVEFLGTIYKTVLMNISKGMRCVQFFMGSRCNFWERAYINIIDIEETLKICERFPTCIFSHFPYISNLAGSVKNLAWKDNTKISGRVVRILKSLKYELGILSNFNNSGVVIHPGNYPDRKKGISTIATSINRLRQFILSHKNSSNIRLLLENSAGSGSSLAVNFVEIKNIMDQVDRDIINNIGVCIDTAHIWGYGEYEISKIEEIERMITDFNKIIGIKNLWLIHLNDSLVKFGSKKDRHAPLSQGEIWKDDISSLLYLLKWCDRMCIPIVMETVVNDMFFISTLENK